MKRLTALTWLAVALSISADLPAEALFVNDATVYTMSSQGVLQGADILIRDGRIKAVGSELPAPVDATVIEARGRPVTPGVFAIVPASEVTIGDEVDVALHQRHCRVRNGPGVPARP